MSSFIDKINDRVSVEKIFAYVMKITAAVAFTFFVISLLIPKLLMRLFTNDKTLIEGGAVYLKIVSLSYFLTGISQIYLCILKNSGKAVKAGIISSVSVVANIFLNAVLIFGLFDMPKLEIAGAALATVIARIIEVAWYIAESLRKGNIALKRCYFFHGDERLEKDFWRYTLPVLGNSGGIIVGNELGAGRLDTAKEYGGKLCRLAIILGLVSGLVMFILSPVILKISDLSNTANDYLKWMTIMCSVYMVGKSVNMTIIDGIFCAGGDSKFGLFLRRRDDVVRYSSAGIYRGICAEIARASCLSHHQS